VSSLSRKKTISGNITHFINSHKHQPVTGTTFIGDFSFSLPTQKEFPQIPSPYYFNNGEKTNVAKCVMRIGLMMDTDFTLEVKKPEPPFTGTLDFYIRQTNACSIWRKYFCVLLEKNLVVYDFELKMVRSLLF
jgi:hypothetical protein